MKRLVHKKSPGKKPAPSGKRPTRPSRAPAPVKPAAAAVKPRMVAPGAARPRPDLLAEIREVRALVSKLVEPPLSAHAALEGGVDSLRRLLSEVIESQMESVVNSLAAVRALAAKGDARAVAAADRLLGELGAVSFKAARLDYVDPLIHRVTGERRDTDAPDGVILETVHPGVRTGRGAVAAKADVIVNRRN